MAQVFGFPVQVNEKAARVVATGVAIFAATILATGWQWLLVPVALGFAARVAAGPRFSPLGRLAANVIAPRLGEPRIVAGAPKRFAQTIGLVMTSVAAIASLGFGQTQVAAVLVAVLLIFATLEAGVGFCAGCWMFAQLMRLGLVPEATCIECADITLRQRIRETANA